MFEHQKEIMMKRIKSSLQGSAVAIFAVLCLVTLGPSRLSASYACENCSGFWGCLKCYAGRAWYSDTARRSGESQTEPKIDDCSRGFILGKHGEESPKSFNDALIKKWLAEAKKVCEDPKNK
jgi:hypothetical protein